MEDQNKTNRLEQNKQSKAKQNKTGLKKKKNPNLLRGPNTVNLVRLGNHRCSPTEPSIYHRHLRMLLHFQKSIQNIQLNLSVAFPRTFIPVTY